MPDYKMVIEDTDLHEGWEYRFEIASDRMAIDTATAYAMRFSEVKWFKRIILWNMGYKQPLCSVYIKKSTEAIVRMSNE